MDGANLHKTATGAGELVLQNSRQAGARRPLGNPTTFIGRNPGCDIRLNVDGVDPLHCLLVVGPEGVQLRDLDSVHGTCINGGRVTSALLKNGDLLKVGPFQFRIELPAPLARDEAPVEETHDALRIQAAAVAAQQVALEEEELRLQQRRADLQQQEEQLAAHLAEKQRELVLWTDYTNSERETLRKEKLAQEKHLADLEADIQETRQEVARDHQKLTQERQRINQIYQRLRQRWQRQWSAEREKYQKHARKLQADALALDERASVLDAREAALKQDVLHFNTQRELATRQLQDGRDTLRAEQARWRRRRSHEFVVLKGIERRADEAQIRLKQARQLLVDEKNAWNKRFEALQKELHGLNNRIVNQRGRVQEQAHEIARLDTLLRERHAQVSDAPATALPAGDGDPDLPEMEVVVLDDSRPTAGAASGLQPVTELDRLAGELADQRLQLIEQYRCLAEIQDEWERQREHAAAELESVAQRLLAQEHALAEREGQTAVVAGMLQQRQEEIEAVRQDLQVWRAQLKARDQLAAEEHAQQLAALAQKETALNEQLVALEQLRERWQERRQAEVEQLRARRAALDEEKKETQKRRVAIFDRGQQLDEEKRILAEKALALEQYRQEVFFRSKDPAAQRRVERLRRRWLTLNATLIRNAKAEREVTKRELHQVEAQRVELAGAVRQLAVNEADVAAKQALLEEEEVKLKARQVHLDHELANLERQREGSDQQDLRRQNEIDIIANAVFDDSDIGPIDQAA